MFVADVAACCLLLLVVGGLSDEVINLIAVFVFGYFTFESV
jgi:hypothetical protein